MNYQKIIYVSLLYFFWCVDTCFPAQMPPKVRYDFTYGPVDAVIPCHEKDCETLERVIEGVRKNVVNIRRIIIVSSKQLTSSAEWFDEKNFPFNKDLIALEVFGNLKDAKKFLSARNSRVGWIYQQLIKLYAMFTIPDLADNVLMVDADTVFLRQVDFQTSSGAPVFTKAYEYHWPYFAHAQRLIPWLVRLHPNISGVAHHMLFQRTILEDFFNTISSIHNKEPWRAMCNCIDKAQAEWSSLSEYEMYFNFTLIKSDQAKIRELKWENLSRIDLIGKYERAGFDYVSLHSYMR